MGTLVAKRYPAQIFGNLADHTYVECGTGSRGWGCWGGKAGGTELRRGTGSTKRANKIAGTNEKARIACYAVNGVCHQAANRVLLPAGITVRGARGYSLSESLFGTYGRVGFWPCKSPFEQFSGTTGDLPECAPPAAVSFEAVVANAADATVQRDWAYTRLVLAMYEKAEAIAPPAKMTARAALAAAKRAAPMVAEFHLELFRLMSEFHLGGEYDRRLDRVLQGIRRKTEREILALQEAYGMGEMTPKEYGAALDAIATKFQLALKDALSPGHYLLLLENEASDPPMTLVDPTIMETVGAPLPPPVKKTARAAVKSKKAKKKSRRRPK